MTGWLCIRSGRGRGCYPIPAPGTVPEQLDLFGDADDVDVPEPRPAAVPDPEPEQ